jgi:hypothetical protein
MDGPARRRDADGMTPRITFRRVLLAAALTSFLVTATPAAAATWQPLEHAEPVSGEAAFDGAGAAYLLDFTGRKLTIRPKGGAFGAPADLLATEPRPADPRFGVSARGEVVLAYTRYPARGRKVHKRVRVVFRAPDGSVSAPRTISTNGRTAEVPQIAVNANGDAIAAWLRHDGTGRWHLQVATRRAGAAFAPAVTAAGGETRRRSRIVVAIRQDGSGVVVFNRPASKSWKTRSLHAVRVDTGGVASSATEIESGESGSSYGSDGSTPQIATGADGTIALLFLRESGQFGSQLLVSTMAPGATSFAAPRPVATSPGPVVGWDLGVDATGRVTVLWASFDALGADTDERIKGRVWTATQKPDGSFTERVGISDAAKTISTEGAGFPGTSIGLEVLPDGRAVAVWAAQNAWRDYMGRIAAAVRAADGTWAAPEYLTPGDQRSYIPALTAAPDGALLVGYIRFPGRDITAQPPGAPLIAGQL